MKTGWWNPMPYDSRSKFHYVAETGRSLCGRWAYLAGDIEDENDTHPYNCSACKKKKLALLPSTQQPALPGGEP